MSCKPQCVCRTCFEEKAVHHAVAVLEAHGRAQPPSSRWLAEFARHLLVDRLARCESPAEESFLCGLAIVAPDLPFVQQLDFEGFRLDFAFVDVKLAVEIDGFNYHDRTPELAERDKARDRKLTLAGWRVCRFSAREVFRDATGCAKAALEIARKVA